MTRSCCARPSQTFVSMIASVVLLGLLHFRLAQSQTLNSDSKATLPSNFTKLQPEVQQRLAINYTGFVYDLTPVQSFASLLIRLASAKLSRQPKRQRRRDSQLLQKPCGSLRLYWCCLQTKPATPNANLTADAIDTNPFLATLPGDGSALVRY